MKNPLFTNLFISELASNRIKKLYPFIIVIFTFLTCITAVENGRSIMDSWQTVGPCVDSSPGKIHAFLGIEFAGLDRTWGHHWFGYPWLRSCFIQVVPFGVATESLISGLFISINAIIIFLSAIRRASPASICMIAPLAYILHPDNFSSLADLRPEASCGFAILCVSYILTHNAAWIPKTLMLRHIAIFLLTMLLPVLSPATLIAGTAIVVCYAIADGLSGSWSRKSGSLTALIAIAFGITSGVVYYIADTDRSTQFHENILGQKEANLNIWSAAKSAWIGPIATATLAILLIPTIYTFVKTIRLFHIKASSPTSVNLSPNDHFLFLLSSGTLSYLLASFV